MADNTSNLFPAEPAPPDPMGQGGAFVIPDIQPIDVPPPPPPPNIPYQQTVVVEEPPQPVPEAITPESPVQLPVEAPIQPDITPDLQMPPQPPPQDSLIIPPAASDDQFIPQGLGPDMSNDTKEPPVIPPPPPIPGRSRGIGRTILLIVIFLLLLGGIGLGIRFGLSYFSDSKEVTLQYWGLWEDESLIQPVIADFEAKNPKIKVQYVKQNHRQYRERLQAAIDRGDGPDVFRFHATWIPMLKNEIQPVPSNIMSPSQFTSSFYKVASQDLLAGSTLWGIPLEIDGLGLYINDDLFTTAGLTPPATYEDLLSLVPRLTVRDGTTIVTSAIALGTSNNVEHFSDILGLMILQNGGKLTDPTGREAEEAYEFYRKFADPDDPMYTWNSLLDNSISAFANGRVAMIMAPSWRAFDIKELSKTLNPDLHFHIEPVPQLPGNTVSWASYWVEGVSSKTKHQKQAMTFLQFLTSKESAVKLYSEASKTRLFGEPYALVELGNNITTDPFVGAYVKQAQYARSFPLASKTHDNGINDRMIKYMEDAINTGEQRVTPAQALDTMSKGFKQVLSSYGLLSSTAP